MNSTRQINLKITIFTLLLLNVATIRPVKPHKYIITKTEDANSISLSKFDVNQKYTEEHNGEYVLLDHGHYSWGKIKWVPGRNISRTPYDISEKESEAKFNQFSKEYASYSLRKAIEETNISKIQEALGQGADPNSEMQVGKEDIEYQSPLIYVMGQSMKPYLRTETEPIIELLLKKGADPYKKRRGGNFDGKNAFEFAQWLASNWNYKKPMEILAPYRKSPQPLASLSSQSLANAINEGRLTLEEIKEGYPVEIVPKGFYEQLEKLIIKK